MKSKATVCICRQCGSTMTVARSRIENGRGRYCSRSCSNAARNPCLPLSLCAPAASFSVRARQATTKKTRRNAVKTCVCLVCETPFVVRAKVQESYCSAMCEVRHALASGEITLMLCPWRTGALEPVEFDSDYWMSPDHNLGF